MNRRLLQLLLSSLRLMGDTAGWGAMALMFGLQAAAIVLESAALVLLLPMMNVIGGADRATIPLIGVEVGLGMVATLFLVVFALRALVQWASAVQATEIQLVTVDTLRIGLINDLYSADWSYLAATRRSTVVQQLTTQVERVRNALGTAVLMVIAAFTLLGYAFVVLVIAPFQAVLAVAAVSLVALLSLRATRGALTLGRALTQTIAAFGAALSDSFVALRVMRAHDAASAWSETVGAEARRVRDLRREYVSRSNAINGIIGLVSVGALLLLVYAGRELGMSLAELAATAVVSTRLLNTAQRILASAQVFANDVPALVELRELDDEIQEHPERAWTVADTAEPAPSSGAALLELRDVDVRYGETPVLTGLSLAVRPHEFVAVMGASGAGKSTLLDVVMGLLRPTAGSVLVDGGPLADLPGWRARLGYVPQQTILVPGTVLQNLSWSMQAGRTLTEDEAWDVLRVADVDAAIAKLPGGLQAPLSELAELSGGEQQRLSIARALARGPELLILDEATSALDRETEARILDRLLDGSRAVLMVTHRDVADRSGTVRVLEAGRLV